MPSHTSSVYDAHHTFRSSLDVIREFDLSHAAIIDSRTSYLFDAYISKFPLIHFEIITSCEEFIKWEGNFAIISASYISSVPFGEHLLDLIDDVQNQFDREFNIVIV